MFHLLSSGIALNMSLPFHSWSLPTGSFASSVLLYIHSYLLRRNLFSWSLMARWETQAQLRRFPVVLVVEQIVKKWFPEGLKAERMDVRGIIFQTLCMLMEDVFSLPEEGSTTLKCLTQFFLWWKYCYFAVLAVKTDWYYGSWICILGAKLSVAVVELCNPAPMWEVFPPFSASCFPPIALALDKMSSHMGCFRMDKVTSVLLKYLMLQ